MRIPRRLSHIWIGPKRPPLDWMRTWPEMNPDWSYRVYDNDYVKNRRFRNQPLIDEYMCRGQYSGAADLIRYETLFEDGGFITEADSICVRPVSEIFETGDLFTVFENEFVRGRLVSPILAATPEHPFVGALIDALGELRPNGLENPWKSTGNYFVARMIERLAPDIVIFPSHYFIPEHYSGVAYEGPGAVYARQFFASGRKLYRTEGVGGVVGERMRSIYRRYIAPRR